MENDDNVAPEVIGAACTFAGCNHVFVGKAEGRAHLKTHHGGMFRNIPAFVMVALSAVLCGACGGLFRRVGNGVPWHHGCQLPGADAAVQPLAGANAVGAVGNPVAQPAAGQLPGAAAAVQPLANANAAAAGNPVAQPAAAGQAPALAVGLPQEKLNAVCLLYDSVFGAQPNGAPPPPVDMPVDPAALPPFPFRFSKPKQARTFLAELLLSARAAKEANNPVCVKLFWAGISYCPRALLKPKKRQQAVQAGNPDPPPAPDRDAARIKQATKEVRLGNNARGFRALAGSMFAAVDLRRPEVQAQLRALLLIVVNAVVMPFVNQAAVPTFSEAQVRTAVMSKASTTAPGFGNWSFKDFQELYRDSDNPHAPAGSKAWPKTLACIINMTAQGVLDRGRLAPALASVRGVVVPKDDEGNIRPLGVASPYCSLTAALLRDDKEIKEKMRGLVDFNDLSHGIKGGSESVSHILRAVVTANPSHVVLKVDFKNAFNSIPRQRVVDIATKIPALGPFLKLVYN
jgi:hypothetical protein